MITNYQYRRSVRSFVKREGRITSAQQEAISSCWDRFGINFSKQKLDLPLIFERDAPAILDIGCGNGDSTIVRARTLPENNFLAVEVHKPGIGALLGKIRSNGLSNVRIINHDICEVLEHQIPANSLEQVMIFFPDPWPKKRHHKRRLINPHFLDLLIPGLRNNARLFMATDWRDYGDHILTVCDGDDRLLNLAGAGNTAPRPCWRPQTRFEQRGIRFDHEVRDYAYALK